MSRLHPRILICCGEPSGDLYGAELTRELRLRRPGLDVFGLGGDRLAAEGAVLLAHVRDLAVVGLVEVVRHLPRLRGVFRRVLKEVDRQRPDLAVLIDYPDFNLRLARELHRRGISVVYYVSPQLWAWRSGRMADICRTVRRMLVIFPFEEALYREARVPVTFVGHPLVDLVKPEPDRAAKVASLGLDPARPVLAILPGSRRQEVAHNLPPLAEAVARLGQRRPDLQFVVAAAPALDGPSLARQLGGQSSSAAVVTGHTHQVVGSATLAVVASGTATVETALLGTPMVVVYRIAALSYALGRRFVKVDTYAMVNLIAGRRVVPELMQAAFTAEAVTEEVLALLGDPPRMDQMRQDLLDVRARLGRPGASARAADAIAQELDGTFQENH